MKTPIFYFKGQEIIGAYRKSNGSYVLVTTDFYAFPVFFKPRLKIIFK